MYTKASKIYKLLLSYPKYLKIYIDIQNKMTKIAKIYSKNQKYLKYLVKVYSKQQKYLNIYSFSIQILNKINLHFKFRFLDICY